MAEAIGSAAIFSLDWSELGDRTDRVRNGGTVGKRRESARRLPLP